MDKEGIDLASPRMQVPPRMRSILSTLLLGLSILIATEGRPLLANPLDLCSKAMTVIGRKFKKHSENYQFVSGWPKTLTKLEARAKSLEDGEAEVFYLSHLDRPTLDTSILLYGGNVYILHRATEPEMLGYAYGVTNWSEDFNDLPARLKLRISPIGERMELFRTVSGVIPGKSLHLDNGTKQTLESGLSSGHVHFEGGIRQVFSKGNDRYLTTGDGSITRSLGGAAVAAGLVAGAAFLVGSPASPIATTPWPYITPLSTVERISMGGLISKIDDASNAGTWQHVSLVASLATDSESDVYVERRDGLVLRETNVSSRNSDGASVFSYTVSEDRGYGPGDYGVDITRSNYLDLEEADLKLRIMLTKVMQESEVLDRFFSQPELARRRKNDGSIKVKSFTAGLQWSETVDQGLEAVYHTEDPLTYLLQNNLRRIEMFPSKNPDTKLPVPDGLPISILQPFFDAIDGYSFKPGENAPYISTDFAVLLLQVDEIYAHPEWPKWAHQMYQNGYKAELDLLAERHPEARARYEAWLKKNQP